MTKTIPKNYNSNNLNDETDKNALLLRNTLTNNLFMGVDLENSKKEESFESKKSQ